MKIALGCPVYCRAWSLPRWFQSVFDNINPSTVDLIFALTDLGEDNTLELIEKYGQKFSSLTIIPCNDLPAFGNRDPERYYPLAILRNRIFDSLKELQPDYYFSWDTDILIPEGTIKALLEDRKDIVAPYCDLVPPGDIPNCCTRSVKGGYSRKKPYSVHYPKGTLFQTDSVFAVQLMESKVFNACTYGWAPGGEDYFFSNEVYEKGFESWMNSRFECTHLYKKDV